MRMLAKFRVAEQLVTYPHPYITQGTRPTVNPTFLQKPEKKRFKKPAAYRRPPSTFHSEATTRLQIRPPQLEREPLVGPRSYFVGELTRSHKIF